MANTKSIDLESTSSQYAYAADSASLSPSTALTIEAWIRTETLPSTLGNRVMIASKSHWVNGSVQKFSYRLSIQTSNKIRLDVSSNGDVFTGTEFLGYDSTSTISNATWTHIAVSLDVSTETFKFYFNGTEENGTLSVGTSLGASIHDNDSRFAIGCWNSDATATDFFDGKIDEVIVWNTVRTPTQISQSYNSGNGKIYNGNETGIAAYYRFEDDADDETSNNNDLTLVNSPSYSTDVPFVGTTGTNMQLNISDTWKDISKLQINIGDSWHEVTKAQINISDEWKTIF